MNRAGGVIKSLTKILLMTATSDMIVRPLLLRKLVCTICQYNLLVISVCSLYIDVVLTKRCSHNCVHPNSIDVHVMTLCITKHKTVKTFDRVTSLY